MGQPERRQTQQRRWVCLAIFSSEDFPLTLLPWQASVGGMWCLTGVQWPSSMVDFTLLKYRLSVWSLAPHTIKNYIDFHCCDCFFAFTRRLKSLPFLRGPRGRQGGSSSSSSQWEWIYLLSHHPLSSTILIKIETFMNDWDITECNLWSSEKHL